MIRFSLSSHHRLLALLGAPLVVLMVALLCLMNGTAQAVTVTPQEIEKAVDDHIRSTTPMEVATPEQLKAKIPQTRLLIEPIKLPSSPIELKGETVKLICNDSRNTPLTFRTIVQVTMLTESETRTIGVPIKLKLEKSVWVSKTYIKARQPIKMGDVMLQTKQLDYDALSALEPKDSPFNYSTRMNLAPGTILDSRKLDIIPLVFRNEDVHILITLNSGVSLTVLGKALQDGGAGQTVRVKRTMTDGSGKIYSGQVMDRGLVKVRM